MQTQTLTNQQAVELALTFIQKEQWTEAENLLRQIIAASPNEGVAHYLLGGVCLSASRLEESIRHSKEAIRRGLQLAGAHANLGVAYMKTGQDELAADAFRSATKLDPNLSLPVQNLISACARLGAWPEYFEALRAFQHHHPGLVETLRSRLADDMMTLMQQSPVKGDDFLRHWECARSVGIFLPQMAERLDRLLSTTDPGPAEIRSFFADCASVEDTLDFAILSMAARHLYETAHCRGDWTAVFFPAVVKFLCLPNIPRDFRKKILLHALRYNLQSSREWNGSLFYGVVVPATRQLLDQGECALAVYLDIHTALSFGQQPLTEAQEQFYWSQMKPLFEQQSPHAASLNIAALKRHKPLNLAFLSLWVNNSSPDHVVFNIIQGLKHSRIDNPLWVAMNGFRPDYRQYLHDSLVRVVDMTKLRGRVLEDDLKGRIETLRTILKNHGIDVLVYAEMYKGVQTLISQSRVAPVQVFLSMGGSYSTEGAEWDGYITGGSAVQRFKEISGRRWRTVSLYYPDPYRTGEGKKLIEQGKALRQEKFRSAPTILASIGRPQKIDNADFMDMLATLLRANPNAIFLWFGKDELASVRAKMVERGISDQCLFQGWQFVPLYAQVIDIHLDAFPFPNGLTIFDTMSAGVPSVFMDTPEARATGVTMHIIPLFQAVDISPEDQARAQEVFYSEQGEPLFLLANDAGEYVAYAQRLIRDVQFRKAAGRASRKFMEAYLFDPERPARELYRHIEEIVEEKIALLVNKEPACSAGKAANHG